MQKIQPEILTDVALYLNANIQLSQKGYMRISYQREVLKRFEASVDSALEKQLALPL